MVQVRLWVEKRVYCLVNLDKTLPVIKRGTKVDDVQACLKSSYSWSSVNQLHLRKNMRVHLSGNNEVNQFSKLLDI